LAFNIQPAKASGTIYIRADGSIDPPTPFIKTSGNVTYTFTGSITDSVVVERDDIVIDGMGYTIQGPGSGTGIDLSGRRNVTLRNTGITAFDYGIAAHYSSSNAIVKNNLTTCNRMGIDLYYSSNNSISGNSITNNLYGIWLEVSSNNTISGNTFTNDGLGVRWSYENWVENNSVNGKPLVYLENVSNYSVDNAGQVILTRCDNIRVEGLNLSETDLGVQLLETNNSIISGNNLANNIAGAYIHVSSNNIISGNDISENLVGIWLYLSLNNMIYHNNFRDNTQQKYVDAPTGDTLDNAWDDGYPSGGNYWSDYNGTDLHSGPYQNETSSDGMGDTPYVIDADNQDRYPLMHPWGSFVLYGDVNGDGTVNILDVILVSEAFGTSQGDSNYDSPSDLNQDGRINILDTILVARHFGQHIP
jgi:parallel beta-helix repeat protein